MNNFDLTDISDKNKLIISKAESFRQSGEIQNSINVFEEFIQKDPENIKLYYQFSLFLYQTGLYNESIQVLILLSTQFNISSSNLSLLLGDSYLRLGDNVQAICSYRDTLRLDAGCEGAVINLSALLGMQGDVKSAISVLTNFLKENTSHNACLNLANLKYLSKDYVGAQKLYLYCLKYKPDNVVIKVNLGECLRSTCEWALLESIEGKVANDTQLQISQKVRVTEPALHHLLRSNNFIENQAIAKSNFKKLDLNTFKTKPKELFESNYIIGYLSDDFGEHPVAYLLLPILRLHKQLKSKVVLIVYGSNDSTDIRKELYEEASEVIFLKGSLIESVEQVRGLNLDIIIDLKGLTLNHRQQMLQYRLAHKQVTFLGYTGTTGNPEMDYILADKTVLGDHNIDYYCEGPLYFDKCFMPMNLDEGYDSNRFTRVDFGLPEGKVVLLISVKPSRITKELFDGWLDVLDSNQNSILWVLNFNDASKQQMKSALEKRELDQTRVLFRSKPHSSESSYLSRQDHLSRLSLADLVLDSWTYNGHSTTVDAIIAEREVICLQGEDWASCVSSSILKSVGCDHLVFSTKIDYIQGILDRIAYILDNKRVSRNHIDLTNSSYTFENWFNNYHKLLLSII